VVGREKILKVHVRKVPLAPDVDLKVLARGTPGFSGADLMNLVNEAALLAARRGKRIVTMHEFEDAKDKVMMGAERRTLVMTDDEKRLTAYHEAGHASWRPQRAGDRPGPQGDDHPPRPGARHGHAAARARQALHELRADDLAARHHDGRPHRRGDDLRPEKVTSGRQSDIEQADAPRPHDGDPLGLLAELGTVAYGENQEEVFLGMSMGRQQNISEATAQKIDGGAPPRRSG
jgi:cell division protease FtsH